MSQGPISRNLNPLSPMNIDRLSGFQKGMGDGTHVTSSLTKTVYAKADEPGKMVLKDHEAVHVETGFGQRNVVADAKRDIFRSLKAFVGKKAANSIFRKNDVNRFGSTRIGWPRFGFTIKKDVFNPNGAAVSKDRLGKMIAEAKGEKFQQELQGMGRDKRLELFGRLQSDDATMTPNEILDDAELAPLYMTFAESEYSAENLPFIKLCGDVDNLLREYAYLEQQHTGRDGHVHDTRNELAAKRDEIRAKVTEIKEQVDSGAVNVGSRQKKAFNRFMARNPINSMEIGRLRQLLKGRRPAQPNQQRAVGQDPRANGAQRRQCQEPIRCGFRPERR